MAQYKRAVKQGNMALFGFLLKKGCQDTGPGALEVQSSLDGWMDAWIEIFLEPQ